MNSTVGFKKFDFEHREFLTNATAITQYGKVIRSCSYLIASVYQNKLLESKLAFPSRWISEKKQKIKILIK